MEKFHHSFDENTVPECPLRTRALLNDITVNRDLVCKILRDLKVSKSGGDDGITNRMLKMVSDSIDLPLSRLFEKIPLTH